MWTTSTSNMKSKNRTATPANNKNNKTCGQHEHEKRFKRMTMIVIVREIHEADALQNCVKNVHFVTNTKQTERPEATKNRSIEFNLIAASAVFFTHTRVYQTKYKQHTVHCLMLLFACDFWCGFYQNYLLEFSINVAVAMFVLRIFARYQDQVIHFDFHRMVEWNTLVLMHLDETPRCP